jgi:NAD(P)H-hydrate repair Nnr-like enzyme with NAD(P)H-hydrate epimerase domain
VLGRRDGEVDVVVDAVGGAGVEQRTTYAAISSIASTAPT